MVWKRNTEYAFAVLMFHKICYTNPMPVERSFWSTWAQKLHRMGLDGLSAEVLDAAGPLTTFLAQLVYLGQPFRPRSLTTNEWQALAQMLEDPQESQEFAAFLREEDKT
jgi:hypothetical protein